MLSNIFIMEALAGMPVKALIRIIKHLDYPSLEMLRSTSQFFRDLPTDKHIYDASLGPTMPSPTSPCTTWTSAAPMRRFFVAIAHAL
jgi:hypothetical protein